MQVEMQVDFNDFECLHLCYIFVEQQIIQIILLVCLMLFDDDVNKVMIFI